MNAHFRHPAFILAALGALSGALGTILPGSNYGAAPHAGAYMVLAGVWFGLVMGFAVWRWGGQSVTAVATAIFAAWAGWELAVNLAVQLDGRWLVATSLSAAEKGSIEGFAAGSVGAFVTWVGAAAFTPALQRARAAVMITVTGALFGLLLPWTNDYDGGAVLLVPWQAAVAAVIGYHLAPDFAASRKGSGAIGIAG
jgi:hypothetical protein